MRHYTWIGVAIAGLALLVSGCVASDAAGEYGEYTEDQTQAKKGIFSFNIQGDGNAAYFNISAKPEDVTALVITISQVEVHRTGDSDAGWHSINIEESTVDIIELGAIEEVIASSEIPAGSYNQLRFLVDEALVTTESGEYEAEVPSGKLKINVSFTVFEDGTTEVTISMDPRASLVVTGSKTNPKYKLKPVIHVVEVEETD